MNIKIIIALLLLVLSLLILLIVLKLIFNAFINTFEISFFNLKMQKYEKKLIQLRDNLDLRDIANKNLIIKSLCLDIQKDEVKTELVFRHNKKALSIIHNISSDKNITYRSIPILEELLFNRKTLNVSLIETTKNKKYANKTASWALPEFKKKINELNENLNTNKSSIIIEIVRLFEDKKITEYH